MFSSHGGLKSYYYNVHVSSWRNTLIKLTHHNDYDDASPEGCSCYRVCGGDCVALITFGVLLALSMGVPDNFWVFDVVMNVRPSPGVPVWQSSH